MDAVIAGEIGENARALLSGSDISLYLYTGSGTVRQAVDEYLRNQEEKSA
jgi:predicted Fe-Mo cluster-binding NifX family protein